MFLVYYFLPAGRREPGIARTGLGIVGTLLLAATLAAYALGVKIVPFDDGWPEYEELFTVV